MPSQLIHAQDTFGVGACIYDAESKFQGNVVQLDKLHENLHNLNLIVAAGVYARVNALTFGKTPRVAEFAAAVAMAAAEWGRIRDYTNAYNELEKAKNDSVKECREKDSNLRSAMAQLHAESVAGSHTDSVATSSSTIPASNYGNGTVTVGRVN